MKNVYNEIEKRYSNILSSYASLPSNKIANAFFQATMQSIPQVQNSRVKEISTLPVDYSKKDIQEALRTPFLNEQKLQQTSEILKYTTYPYYKLIKTLSDIPSYKYYANPLYVTEYDGKFIREAELIDKFNKTLNVPKTTHKITGQALTMGKVFYTPRYSVDKIHNKVNYAFLQQLPQSWCKIVGFNNISGYTISFDMMYFLQPGTDWRQFGDLFEPYLDEFKGIMRYDNGKVSVNTKKIKNNSDVYYQNGRWLYYVTLPPEKVWTFEIDDTTPAVVPPLSGLMLTYSQQADFEAIQKELVTNPLLKIFTGEVPYHTDTGTTAASPYKLSNPMQMYYVTLFHNLLSAANTGGTDIFFAPVENIKSHDYTESANANEVAESFTRYATEKAGITSLIPVSDDVKASQVESSQLIEGEYVAPIYRQMENLMRYIYESLNLRYSWDFKMFGTIFNEKTLRDNAQKAIANGDISQHFILAALDNQSWLEKITMMKAIQKSGMLDMLIPPITSYTMKQEYSGLPPQAGRPETEEITESKEKSE